MSTTTIPRSHPTYACRPAMVTVSAPRSAPSGLNVSARVRKLFDGLPSVSVETSTRISPSSRSLMYA
jgi:hypothetical protein